MGVNKVIFGGDVLIDLTGDSVTPDTMADGTTAHDAQGRQIVGTALCVRPQIQTELAENLTAMGVTLTGTETLEELTGKVLEVLDGGAGVFSAALREEWDVSYGVFTTGETVEFAGVAAVTAAVRVVRLTYTITGEGAASLSGTGEGWTVRRTDAGLTAVYSAGKVLSMTQVQGALDGFSIAGDGSTNVNARVTLEAQTHEGNVFQAAGTAKFEYAYVTTWKILGGRYATYGDVVNTGKTWGQLQQFSKE